LLPADADYSITQQGLIVADSNNAQPRLVTPLKNSAAKSPFHQTRPEQESLEPQELKFGSRPISWERWVSVWQQEESSASPVESSPASLIR
jgi:hypothetical protein